jgi:hypothetical protein
MLAFLMRLLRGLVLTPRLLMARVCLLGMVGLLVTGSRYRITRKRGEHGQGAQTSQRPETLVHFVIPREPDGQSHEIARCTRLELPKSYHTADSQLLRLGNSVAKTWRAMKEKVVAGPVRFVMHLS